MIKASEEKLELEVSIPRKLHDGWEPTIKVKIKNYECFALCDLGVSDDAPHVVAGIFCNISMRFLVTRNINI